jgi:hypothetical protein
MAQTNWAFKGREFINCNCTYGCPCQFNGLPSHGFCQAVGGFQIDEGYYGDTRLDGLRFVGMFRWPGAIHEGHGECVVVIDERATPEQREALLRIVSGQDTKPGSTVFNVFASTMEKVHDPIFAPIDFEVDVDSRRARLVVAGITEGRGEPIVNPVTGHEHRARIDLPDGFEYTLAEIGRGWTDASGGPVPIQLNDSYGQFSRLHLSQDGVVH